MNRRYERYEQEHNEKWYEGGDPWEDLAKEDKERIEAWQQEVAKQWTPLERSVGFTEFGHLGGIYKEVDRDGNRIDLGPRKTPKEYRPLPPHDHPGTHRQRINSSKKGGEIQELDPTAMQPRRILLSHSIQKKIPTLRLPPLWKKSEIGRFKPEGRIPLKCLQ